MVFFWQIGFALLILETAVFIAVASLVGVGGALGLCVLSAFAGLWLVRHQGLDAMMGIVARGRADPRQMLDAGALIVAGLLLIVPGFLSDLAALALIIPALRRSVQTGRDAPFSTSGHNGDENVIEGRYEVVDIDNTDGTDTTPQRALDEPR